MDSSFETHRGQSQHATHEGDRRGHRTASCLKRDRIRWPPWWLTASWAAILLGLLASWVPGKLGFLLLCPLRTVTGVPCPTCGATHATMLLLQLRVLDAVRCNPLVALAGLCVAGLCVLGTPLWLAGHVPGIRLDRTWLRVLRVLVPLMIAANWLYLVLTAR